MTALDRLMSTVALLASDADTQARHLDALGLRSDALLDELALKFDDDFRSCARDQFSTALVSALDDLSSALDAVSGAANLDFWQRSALHDDPRWARIRTLAHRALSNR